MGGRGSSAGGGGGAGAVGERLALVSTDTSTAGILGVGGGGEPATERQIAYMKDIQSKYEVRSNEEIEQALSRDISRNRKVGDAVRSKYPETAAEVAYRNTPSKNMSVEVMSARRRISRGTATDADKALVASVRSEAPKSVTAIREKREAYKKAVKAASLKTDVARVKARQQKYKTMDVSRLSKRQASAFIDKRSSWLADYTNPYG